MVNNVHLFVEDVNYVHMEGQGYFHVAGEGRPFISLIPLIPKPAAPIFLGSKVLSWAASSSS